MLTSLWAGIMDAGCSLSWRWAGHKSKTENRPPPRSESISKSQSQFESNPVGQWLIAVADIATVDLRDRGALWLHLTATDTHFVRLSTGRSWVFTIQPPTSLSHSKSQVPGHELAFQLGGWGHSQGLNLVHRSDMHPILISQRSALNWLMITTTGLAVHLTGSGL